MIKLVCSIALLGLLVNGSTEEEDANKTVNIKEKMLYLNVDRYNQALEKDYEKNKNKPKMKIYRRKDGTIDTFKTINEAQ